jgi:hypothetical protein
MKRLKNILVKSFFAFAIALFSVTFVSAQELDKAVVEKAITSKSFVFKAQTVFPMAGTSRPLTSEYDVRLLGDSVVAYLPYFGRAYSITYGERGGIDFTSTKFDYNIEARKKGGWDVTIKPKDDREVRELNFTISENGYTSLLVNSNNKQPISYNGYIAVKK